MYRIVSLLSAITITLSLGACNSKDPTQPKPPTPQATGVIPQAQLDALNKAKAVEDVLKQGAQRSELAE